jgi:cytochrome c oxidase subunit 1
MWLAGICGAMLLVAFGAFLLNIVMILGLKGALGVFQKSALDKDELLPIA